VVIAMIYCWEEQCQLEQTVWIYNIFLHLIEACVHESCSHIEHPMRVAIYFTGL
jgi:hypothetical protein